MMLRSGLVSQMFCSVELTKLLYASFKLCKSVDNRIQLDTGEPVLHKRHLHCLKLSIKFSTNNELANIVVTSSLCGKWRVVKPCKLNRFFIVFHKTFAKKIPIA